MLQHRGFSQEGLPGKYVSELWDSRISLWDSLAILYRIRFVMALGRVGIPIDPTQHISPTVLRGCNYR